MRLISDELHANLVKILADDPKVAAFRELLLAPKTEPAAAQPEEINEQSEGEK